MLHDIVPFFGSIEQKRKVGHTKSKIRNLWTSEAGSFKAIAVWDGKDISGKAMDKSGERCKREKGAWKRWEQMAIVFINPLRFAHCRYKLQEFKTAQHLSRRLSVTPRSLNGRGENNSIWKTNANSVNDHHHRNDRNPIGAYFGISPEAHTLMEFWERGPSRIDHPET